MPTYAYACSSCEHAFDIRQSFSDDPLTVCPQCEQESLRKVFSPVGVVFKGSGFYRNDSRAAKKGKVSSSTSASSKTAPASAGASSKDSAGSGASGSGTGSGSGSAGSGGGSGSSGSSTATTSKGSSTG